MFDLENIHDIYGQWNSFFILVFKTVFNVYLKYKLSEDSKRIEDSNVERQCINSNN